MTQKMKSFAVLPAFIVAVLAAQLAFVAPTYAATLEWTGAGDGTSFSDGANWGTGTAPADGDVIVLPGFEDLPEVTLDNDLPDVALGGLTMRYEGIAGPETHQTNYTIDLLRFADGAILNQDVIGNTQYALAPRINLENYDMVMIGEGDIYTDAMHLSGTVTVAGDLHSTRGAGYFAIRAGSTIGGTVYIDNGGNSIDDDMTVGAYVLGDYGRLQMHPSQATQLTTPITVNGTGARIVLSTTPDWDEQTNSAIYNDTTFTISSPIVLNNNLAVSLYENVTGRFTGNITYNGNTIAKEAGSAGTLIIGEETIVPDTKTTELNGNEPGEYVQVTENETAVLNGTRGVVTVNYGGVLKGVGTVRTLYVERDGVVAPGNSPGTITVLEELELDGTYQFELKNAQAYDQLIVGQDFDNGSSYDAVRIDSASARLDMSLLSDWSIEQGDSFMIIDNRSETPVDGYFNGLSEGSQFTYEGVVFNITYTGGDGNDVVLTALNAGSAPAAPNTGTARHFAAQPAVLAGLGLLTAGALLSVAVVRRNVTR